MFSPEPLIRIERGGQLESVHRGMIAVADASGRLLAHVGDADVVVFPRSGLKPFQLLPLVESGAADHFHFEPADLALMSASHAGQPAHIDRVRSLLSRIGIAESALACGAHAPVHGPSADALRAAGQFPSALHNNCSGKHAGMIAAALFHGDTVDGYETPEHPVQRRIRDAVATAAGLHASDIVTAIDGCSAPALALPLHGMATAFARLAAASSEAGHIPPGPSVSRFARQTTWTQSAALARIGAAMRSNAFFVAGDGRFDTVVMDVAAGRVVSKTGAEGFYGAGVSAPAIRLHGWDGPIGIAIKIEDGDVRRAGSIAMMAALTHVGALVTSELARLDIFREWTLRNQRGTAVGRAAADFQLRWLV